MRARRFESCLGRSVRIGVGAVYRARLESVSLLMGTQVRILSNSSNNMPQWQSGLMRTAANRESLKMDTEVRILSGAFKIMVCWFND